MLRPGMVGHLSKFVLTLSAASLAIFVGLVVVAVIALVTGAPEPSIDLVIAAAAVGNGLLLIGGGLAAAGA